MRETNDFFCVFCGEHTTCVFCVAREHKNLERVVSYLILSTYYITYNINKAVLCVLWRTHKAITHLYQILLRLCFYTNTQTNLEIYAGKWRTS